VLDDRAMEWASRDAERKAKLRAGIASAREAEVLAAWKKVEKK
jgi:hypothetical protein